MDARSESNLALVHPDLVKVIRGALQTPQPFIVGEGVRSAADQLRDWYRRATKLNGIPVGQFVNGVRGTGVGNHQIKPDGFGHAVDLLPMVNGEMLWTLPADQQWQYIYPVADVMRTAAIACNIRLRWGAVWDRCLNDLKYGGPQNMAAEVRAYELRHAGPDFLDGVHFELMGP